MAFNYDANGNMRTNRGLELRWDEKDRLAGLTNDQTGAEYLYNYTDTRKKKTIADKQVPGDLKTVWYIDKFTEIRDNRLYKHAFAQGTRTATTGHPGYGAKQLQPERFYLQDNLGSLSQNLRSDGTVEKCVASHPFGHGRKRIQRADLVYRASYEYTGKERDVESELLYFGSRYYSPELARFLSVDAVASGLSMSGPDLLGVLGQPKNLNGYCYTSNNPIIYVDAEGLWKAFLEISLGVQAFKLDVVGLKGGYTYDSEKGHSVSIGGTLFNTSVSGGNQGGDIEIGKGFSEYAKLKKVRNSFGINAGVAHLSVGVAPAASLKDGAKVTLNITGGMKLPQADVKISGSVTINAKEYYAFLKSGGKDVTYFRNAEFKLTLTIGKSAGVSGTKASIEGTGGLSATGDELIDAFSSIKESLATQSSGAGSSAPATPLIRSDVENAL